jgi:hypothetical protein
MAGSLPQFQNGYQLPTESVSAKQLQRVHIASYTTFTLNLHMRTQRPCHALTFLGVRNVTLFEASIQAAAIQTKKETG